MRYATLEQDMKKFWDYVIVGMKVIALGVLFVAFSAIVKPEIASRVIPEVVDFSVVMAESGGGVDLDPVYLTQGNSSYARVTGLYSTKHAYSGDGIYGDLVTSDTRVVAMNRFLADYDSPMAKYAEVFVDSADQVGLDWRLVASISGVESAFGRLIPHNSYNAWGWKGGPGGDFSMFAGWEDGISWVTNRIAVGYGTEISVFDMESTYCPPCGMNPRHEWANGVARYLEQLSDYRRRL